LPPLYSHSRLSCFENCPKQFHYRYVLRVPAESESIESYVGKRVHDVLERLHQFVGRGLVPSLDKVLARFRQLWRDGFDPARIRIVREENDVAHYQDFGERCLRHFYRRHYPFDADETLGLEERITAEIDPARGYRVQGFIDRLARARDGAIEIHDYKTARRLPSQRQLDGDRQLALYQLAVGAAHPEAPIRLVWHFLAVGATRTSTRTPEQLAELRAETAERIARIEAEDRFEARPGPLCAWCEYSAQCPAAAARRGAPAPLLPPPEPTRAPVQQQLVLW
jgi:putative RecB family exonuclease